MKYQGRTQWAWYPSMSRIGQQKNQLFLVQGWLKYNNNYLTQNKKKRIIFHKSKMSILLSSQNQSSSQFPKQEEQPDLEKLLALVNSQLNPESAFQIASKIGSAVKACKKRHFQKIQAIVVQLIQKGYNKEVAKISNILQAMMDMFCHLTKEMDENLQAQHRVMCLLSIIAELIKEAPQLQVSIKKKFLQSLLLIDEELLQSSSIKKDVLAVLAVLYQCLSKQTKALKKFQLLKQFKKAVLSNYSLIEQHFSCRLFNKALYNLAVQGEALTEAELSKFGVFKTLSKILGHEQAVAVIEKIKSVLMKLSMPKPQITEPRSQMIAES